MHGYSGPLKVSYGGASSNVGKQFLEAAALYDKDRVSTGDPSDPRSCDVYGVGSLILFLMVLMTRFFSNAQSGYVKVHVALD